MACTLCLCAEGLGVRLPGSLLLREPELSSSVGDASSGLGCSESSGRPQGKTELSTEDRGFMTLAKSLLVVFTGNI